jgi:glycosyltransferase involved in cell wall biosynthesis
MATTVARLAPGRSRAWAARAARPAGKAAPDGGAPAALEAFPFVSVIVPTFNDNPRLGRCLAALETQTYPASRYEVIVVDDGSDPPASRVTAGLPRVRALAGAHRGSYAARNQGLAVARGPVVAFTDSDCLPARDWIECGVRALAARPGCGLVAGAIEVFPAEAERRTWVELYESVFAFPQHEYVAQGHFGATANLFTRLAVFERVGRFDERLGSGGDAEWGRRVFAHGFGQAYEASVRVRHPARRTLREMRAKVARTTAAQRERLRGHRVGYRLALLWRVVNVLKPPVRPVWVALRAPLRLSERLRVVGVALAVRGLVLRELVRRPSGGQATR